MSLVAIFRGPRSFFYHQCCRVIKKKRNERRNKILNSQEIQKYDRKQGVPEIITLLSAYLKPLWLKKKKKNILQLFLFVYFRSVSLQFVRRTNSMLKPDSGSLS